MSLIHPIPRAHGYYWPLGSVDAALGLRPNGLQPLGVLLMIVWLDKHWTENPNFVQSLSKLCPIVQTLSSLCPRPVQWLSKYSVCPGKVQALSNVCQDPVHCLKLGQKLDIHIQ